MSDQDRQEPGLDSSRSILDELNKVPDHPEEVIATSPSEKFSVLSLLSNKRNKKLVLIFLAMSIFAVFLIIYSFSRVSGEQRSKSHSSSSENEKVENVLPSGELTQAQLKEIDRYNNENLDGHTQPIAIEKSAENTEPLDVSLGEDIEYDEISGCNLDDTACMVIKNRIKPGECAPKDSDCIINKTGEPINSTEKRVEVVKLTEHEKQLKRLENKEYVDQMSKRIKAAAEKQEKLVVDRGEIVDFSKFENESNEDDQNLSEKPTTIAGGILTEGNGAKKEELIVNSGDRLMGSADIALNSKIQGEVSLTVFGGVFIETRMLGTVKRVDDYMRLELYNWVLPDGRECDITAVALDKKTTYAAVASRVDHHTLYRYGWWGLGAVLNAVGKASQDNIDREVIINNNGSAIESTKKDSERELKMALGSLGEDIGKIMQKRLDTPSTVHIDVNETMGVFFVKPVTTNHCKMTGIEKHTAKTPYYFQ